MIPYGIVTFLQERNLRKAQDARQRMAIDIFNKLVASGNSINIELGAGDRTGTNGWTTMDIHPGSDIPYDLLQKLPFPESSVDKIYSSHFLEHFHTKDIVKILNESYRVLKPGGWISACVPNGSIYVKAYAERKKLDADVWFRHKPAASNMFSEIDGVNYIAYLDDEHKHLFDIENLCALFKNSNFRNVEPRQFITGLDMEVRDYQSIYVQATK
jgi:predicted SAM-dependent methyltransferase